MADHHKLIARRVSIITAGVFLSFFMIPIAASALECVPYARQVSNFTIRGNAWTWWNQAPATGYKTGSMPQVGSAIVFKRTQTMPLGHVGVVRRLVSSREIIIDHANWSSGGRVDRNASVIDVSLRNDWQRVRVWYPQIKDYGGTIYSLYGFVYDDRNGKQTLPIRTNPVVVRVKADQSIPTKRPTDKLIAVSVQRPQPQRVFGLQPNAVLSKVQKKPLIVAEKRK